MHSVPLRVNTYNQSGNGLSQFTAINIFTYNLCKTHTQAYISL